MSKVNVQYLRSKPRDLIDRTRDKALRCLSVSEVLFSKEVYDLAVVNQILALEHLATHLAIGFIELFSDDQISEFANHPEKEKHIAVIVKTIDRLQGLDAEIKDGFKPGRLKHKREKYAYVSLLGESVYEEHEAIRDYKRYKKFFDKLLVYSKNIK